MIISRHTRYYNRAVATRKQWEQKVKLGLLFDIKAVKGIDKSVATWHHYCDNKIDLLLNKYKSCVHSVLYYNYTDLRHRQGQAYNCKIVPGV